MQKSARRINVTNNPTEHIQNSAQNTNVTQIVENTFKTVRKALTYQKIKQNTYKIVRKAPTSQTVNETHKNQCVRHYRNKLSRKLIPNTARDTRVTKRQQNE